jgi:formylglycine-generating enzyme required for sulfatase activity
MPLTVGQVLEKRYRIDALLGQGGMGAVYRATDLRLSISVALKENLEATPEAQRQFGREAGILASLHHPNLPRVTDYFFIPSQGQYLVMDYIEGQDLGQVLAQHGAIPEAEALGWIGRVLDALDYLHGEGIIHRDIKPANIKIAPKGQVFLVDFGLAKAYDPALLTTAGARAVTPGFAPPEQYGMGRTDARSDLYSVGATLYALLTGTTPPDALETLTKQAHLTPPRQLNATISPQAEAAIMRAMQAAPSDRFQSAAAFRAALATPPPTLLAPAEKETSASATPQPLPPRARARQRRSTLPAWFWPVAGGAAALFVLIVIGVMLLGRGGANHKATATLSLTRSAIATVTATPAARPSDTPLPPTTVSGPTATRAIQRTATAAPTLTSTPEPTPPPTATALSAPTPPPTVSQAGATTTRPKDGAVMVFVPAGEFRMGSSDAIGQTGMDNLQHKVYLDAFWIDKTEVTNARYRQCVEAGACTESCASADSQFNKDYQPVVCVNWDDATAYCQWAGARLPTEAEWEKAARGTDSRAYPWGYEEPDCNRARYRTCGWATEVVGSLRAGASPCGALDMAGNVDEWIADWYAVDYYTHSPAHNPTGPDSGQYRVLRGGSWGSESTSLLRSSNRNRANPDRRNLIIGFRCGLSPTSSP